MTKPPLSLILCASVVRALTANSGIVRRIFVPFVVKRAQSLRIQES